MVMFFYLRFVTALFFCGLFIRFSRKTEVLLAKINDKRIPNSLLTKTLEYFITPISYDLTLKLAYVVSVYLSIFLRYRASLDLSKTKYIVVLGTDIEKWVISPALSYFKNNAMVDEHGVKQLHNWCETAVVKILNLSELSVDVFHSTKNNVSKKAEIICLLISKLPKRSL